MTDRIVRAVEHPLVDAIGHLTGRKLERRASYALDVERVIEVAARTGTMLEINSNPDRRDLNDIHARAAAAAGVPIVINADSHRVGRLRGRALRDRHRPPRLADRRAGREHRAVAGDRGDPPAPPAGATVFATVSSTSVAA